MKSLSDVVNDSEDCSAVISSTPVTVRRYSSYKAFRGILPVGAVMCARPASRIFGPLRCFTLTRKANTMSNSAKIVLGLFESSHGGVTKAVDKRPHYVGVASLSVFGDNFVLAKVHRGLINVRCSELRGVRFSEVRNVLVLW